jgi:uncharacterized membrane protein YkvA (DUF1232 family)/lambda repressor-like predicted transcriptional regulator
MNVPGQMNQLKAVLQPHLERSGLSLRKVAASVGVNPATLSRVLAGKVRPKPELLKAVADRVGAEHQELLVAAGYLEDRPSTLDRVLREFVPAGGGVAATLGDPERLSKELKTFEAYAATPEGQRRLTNELLPKLRALGAAGVFADRLKAMYRYFADPAAPPAPKLALGAALLYFVVSIDLVPDFLFPVGYLDDAVVVTLVWNQWRQVLAGYLPADDRSGA